MSAESVEDLKMISWVKSAAIKNRVVVLYSCTGEWYQLVPAQTWTSNHSLTETDSPAVCLLLGRHTTHGFRVYFSFFHHSCPYLSQLFVLIYFLFLPSLLLATPSATSHPSPFLFSVSQPPCDYRHPSRHKLSWRGLKSV